MVGKQTSQWAVTIALGQAGTQTNLGCCRQSKKHSLQADKKAVGEIGQGKQHGGLPLDQTNQEWLRTCMWILMVEQGVLLGRGGSINLT